MTDPKNPNYPAKTGNKSGPGRGNQPKANSGKTFRWPPPPAPSVQTPCTIKGPCW